MTSFKFGDLYQIRQANCQIKTSPKFPAIQYINALGLSPIKVHDEAFIITLTSLVIVAFTVLFLGVMFFFAEEQLRADLEAAKALSKAGTDQQVHVL